MRVHCEFLDLGDPVSEFAFHFGIEGSNFPFDALDDRKIEFGEDWSSLVLSLLGYAIVLLAPLRLLALPPFGAVISRVTAAPPVGAGIVIAVNERPRVHDG